MKTCSARVYDSRSVRTRACARPATVERIEARVERMARKVYDEATFTFTTEYDERTVEVTCAYCRQHDPVDQHAREEKKHREETARCQAQRSRDDALLADAKRRVEQLKVRGVVASAHYTQDYASGGVRSWPTPTGAVVVGADGVEKILALAERVAEYESR